MDDPPETNMTKQSTVKVTVFNSEQYDPDWPFNYDTKLKDVVHWFNAKLAEIPAEYRDKARCDIDSNGDGDMTLRISYWRPETPAECEERLTREEITEARNRIEALAMARAILARYGEHS
jgi:hypothetical protein